MKDEIKKLEDHEHLLDTHTQWIQQSIKNIENDIVNKKYAYISYEDVKENFPDDFVLGIQAPPDTELSVPNMAQVNVRGNILQIYCKAYLYDLVLLNCNNNVLFVR